MLANDTKYGVKERQMPQLNLSEKATILSKPIWSYSDIKDYFGFCTTKSTQLKKKVVERGGGVDFCPTKVKADFVFKELGLNREDEIKRISSLIKGGDQNADGQ